MEIWKDVVGYEGLYAVSNSGLVKALSKLIVNKGRSGDYFSKEKPMKLRLSNKGYLKVMLRKDKTDKFKSVHRLVAEAFLINDLGKPQVNHIDGNKLNNQTENLEWCTQKENMLHAFKTGLSVPPKHDAMVLNLENGLFYQTLKDFREAVGSDKDRVNEKIRAGKLSQYLKIPYASL